MNKKTKESAKVLPGVEVFLQDFVDFVKGKRVGLVTNPTGVDSLLESTVDLFVGHSGINLTALFGPEHGLSGFAQAGEVIPLSFDSDYGLPVYSLYGQNEEVDLEKLQDLDETMRLFDTQDRGKNPRDEMLENIDVMMFDLQDVGTRIYTYIATMALCMQGCAHHGIDFIVLDRPNPINGVTMEGPLLDYPEFSSFVGMYSIPVRHGMTIGELAQLFNALYLRSKVNLTIVPMKSWKREMWFDETGLPWIAPSPNMPTVNTAMVYPGQVFLEGTNISEGRGTAMPFELFGAPWIKGRELARRLNRLILPGVTFRETRFLPTFSKYKGELCQGCQIYIRDRDEYRPLETVLQILKTALEDYPDSLVFHSGYFDAIMGSGRVRKSLLDSEPVNNIVEDCARDLREFEKKRKPFLLY